LRCALLGLADDFLGAIACFLDRLLGLLRGHFKGALALLGGSQPVADLLLPLLDRVHERRPDELDGEPDE